MTQAADALQPSARWGHELEVDVRVGALLLLNPEEEAVRQAVEEARLEVVDRVHPRRRPGQRLGERVVLLSFRPGEIKREYSIELVRPRHIEQIDVARTAREILDCLREEINKSLAAEYGG